MVSSRRSRRCMSRPSSLRESDRNREKTSSRTSEKYLRPLGGSSCRTRRAPQSSFQQDSKKHGDKGQSEELGRKKMDTRSKRTSRKPEEAENVLLKDEDKSQRVAELIGQHNYSKAVRKRSSMTRDEAEQSGTDMEDNLYPELAKDSEKEVRKTEAEHTERNEEERGRTSRGDPVGGRKRSAVRQGGTSFKRIKAELCSDENMQNDSSLSPESSEQSLAKGTAPQPPAQSSGCVVTLKNGQSEALKNPPPAKPVRKQGFHNPNRFSREPLYRVIKNQPPPVLSINLDHNPFKCSSPGCPKSFRNSKLLNYHMKYYHGEDRPRDEGRSPTPSVQTGVKEKPSDSDGCEGPDPLSPVSWSSKAEKSSAQIAEKRLTPAPPAVSGQELPVRPLLKEKSRENQLDRNGRRTVEKSPMDAARVNRTKGRKSRGFLHIKVKKKKKKKKKSKSGGEENVDISGSGLQSNLNLPLKPQLSHGPPAEAYCGRPGHGQADRVEMDDEDSISDWSSDSYGWSTDDTGADLHIISSHLSCGSVAAATSGQEVHCICEVEDENDFMIQCEECQRWQHGSCMGLLEERVPDRYTCFVCRDPAGRLLTYGQRQSRRYWYYHKWLSSGHMYGLSFLEENYSDQNSRKITATHQLLGDVQHVVEVLNGLQLKISVLQSQTHPDLKLWCQPWKQTEQCRQKAVCIRTSEAVRSFPHVPHRAEAKEQLSEPPGSSSSARNSYVSSEHCYQKPWVCYPSLEERLVVERWRGPELEDSLRGSKSILQYEELHMGEQPSLQAAANQDHHASVVTAGNGEELKVSAQNQQWQINLLEHIESVQQEITHRMDFIERELDVLESWLDYTGELEPPEPLERLPELKHNIKHLMGELEKVHQIALACST